MNVAEAALRQAAADMDTAGVGWAVIGGFAVTTRTAPRFTHDVDFAVAVAGDPEAEALVYGLRAKGYLPAVVLDQEEADRLSTVRLTRQGFGDVTVDLMFASSGIEEEIVRAAERLEVIPGVRMPVAVVGHLITLKLLANRPHDLLDLSALIAVATEKDLSVARQAAEMITARGFHRGRDLVGDLEDLVQREG